MKELFPGDVVLVSLDPHQGSEQNGTRPCIVISPHSLNSNLSICVVVPLTTSLKEWPTRVMTQFNQTQGQAAIEQIRTISQSRIYQKREKIPEEKLNEIRLVIKNTYVDV